ncbi:hypothetical protein BKA83DRAFT_524794 [Pisolithus microcarpus]|nr:hypothetical protein BKA83DRAFT_524794 [Pisolithus microcarpus]
MTEITGCTCLLGRKALERIYLYSPIKMLRRPRPHAHFGQSRTWVGAWGSPPPFQSASSRSLTGCVGSPFDVLLEERRRLDRHTTWTSPDFQRVSMLSECVTQPRGKHMYIHPQFSAHCHVKGAWSPHGQTISPSESRVPLCTWAMPPKLLCLVSQHSYIIRVSRSLILSRLLWVWNGPETSRPGPPNLAIVFVAMEFTAATHPESIVLR